MKKALLILIALALLAGLVVIGSRPDEPVAASVSEAEPRGVDSPHRGPSFAVQVVMPRLARPFFGILPEPLVPLVDGTPREVGFDHASRGAAMGRVGHDRLELSAEGGWDLSIETDREGRIAPGTRLVFPLALGGRQVTMHCRPAAPAIGYLRTTTQAGSDELGGRFLVKLATCRNAKSGKATEWPPAPLTLLGSFDRLPHGAGRAQR